MWDNRRYIIQGAFVLIGLVFLIKLFAIQVLDKDYRTKAERNIIQPIVQYPFRGLIYDRNKQLIVYNEPVYDLMVVPKDVAIADTTEFCELLGIEKEVFLENMKTARTYSRVKPSVFLKKISHEEYGKIQDLLYKYSGFFVNPRTVRGYTSPVLANELGYTGEISRRQLDRDTTGYYRSGDNIGITGLEEQYERLLSGKRGVSYKQVNVRGIEKGSFKDGALDTVSVPGTNLITTIDLELQTYAEKLLKGKTGSIVAIDPSTGEVLVMATAPTYEPKMLSGREFGKNYGKIASDSAKLLFNRAHMATYPAGSVFKTVQALIALDEGVIKPNEQIYVDLSGIGDHAPAGYYDVARGIEKSSNNYFLEVMRRLVVQRKNPNYIADSRIGLALWADAVKKFGFGAPLGIDIPGEASGLIPDVDYYDKIYVNKNWGYSTVQSLSIGQGEILVTPLQVANLAAIIANRGYYIQPHLVKGFEKDGTVTLKQFEKKYTGKGSDYYPAIIEGMKRSAQATTRAPIKDIVIASKTGTAENGAKDETLDHSVFMAFAPVDDPKIAIAVYIENAGWGGRAAATTASLVMEMYLKGYIEKDWRNREEYVLKGDFLDEEQKREIERKKQEKARKIALEQQ
ncbi:penicillin-binding transpeptidase domain-containing protein [Roseivirga seohaensis]|uniref:penicillin-binding transpeptidase domain-containing protein n=1 Tax=Roseivirga seohaensis TaxID=1914963 RepID=UPI0008F6921F|nr:penicillin-binding transpeptidase domain-containing protein [Roseivirga seohaensis]